STLTLMVYGSLGRTCDGEDSCARPRLSGVISTRRATKYRSAEPCSFLTRIPVPEKAAARRLSSPCRHGRGEDSSLICPVLSCNLSHSPGSRTATRGRKVGLRPSTFATWHPVNSSG